MTASARPFAPVDAGSHVARSDCEEIRPGWLGQPANALSSLAFVVGAVPIIRRALSGHPVRSGPVPAGAKLPLSADSRRRDEESSGDPVPAGAKLPFPAVSRRREEGGREAERGRRDEGRGRRWPWVAVGLASVVAGVGSVGYHGPGDRASKLVHDLGIDALAVSLMGSTIFAGDFRRLSPRTAALGATALALHQLSQTGRPLCSCRSPLQGHAVFHLLAATAIVSAVDDQLGPRPESEASPRSRPSPDSGPLTAPES